MIGGWRNPETFREVTEGDRLAREVAEKEAAHQHASYDDPPREETQHRWQFWKRRAS